MRRLWVALVVLSLVVVALLVPVGSAVAAGSDTGGVECATGVFGGVGVHTQTTLPGVGAATISYQLLDPMGTVTTATDAAGAVVGSSDYGPFGELLSSPAVVGDVPTLGYLGMPTDPANPESWHLRARDYTPGIGRFTSPDPVPLDLGAVQATGYAYSLNDPLGLSDPSGLSWTDDVGDFFSGVKQRFDRAPGVCFEWECGSASVREAGVGVGAILSGALDGIYMVGKCANDGFHRDFCVAYDYETPYTDAWMEANRRAGADVDSPLVFAPSLCAGAASAAVAIRTLVKRAPQWLQSLRSRPTKLTAPSTTTSAANGGSRLAEASAAAFRAADNPSSIFIKNKHLASSGIRGGKFASDDIAEVQGWVAQGLRSDGVQFLPNQLDDTFRAIVPAGRVVGTAGQTNIRVIVTNDGRVINAFPVNVR